MSRLTSFGRFGSVANLLSAVIALLAAVTTTRAQFTPPFTEEALTRGLSYAVGTPLVGNGYGYGLAFVDVDSDGDADTIVLGATSGAVGLFENDGAGQFTNRSNGLTLPAPAQASGVAAADYDDDGDPDIYITRWLESNVLLRNDGNWQFTDVTSAAGVADTGAGSGCAWGDFDGDTWLDLHATNRTTTSGNMAPNRMYHNLGNGQFADVAAALSVDSDDLSFQAVFFDHDFDGDGDLYLSNDRGYEVGWQNRFWENDNGAMVDITASTGTEANMNSMGVAVGDFDGNGFTDLYCTNTIEGNKLFLNQGDGTYPESAHAAGVQSFEVGWGTLFFDFDNDTDLDLYVCNYGAANRLYENKPTWPCNNVAVALNVDDAASSFGVATADIDNDGDLDLMVSSLGANVRLYINHAGETRQWIKFRVVGQGHNRAGIGAIVRVTTGSLTQYREILAGSNYKSQNELVTSFGLNTATIADQVRVTWPGGDERTLTGLASQQTWTLHPDEALGHADADADIDLSDFSAFALCFTGPTPGALTPGCEMMDFDGDADVDLGDFSAFALRFTGPL